MGTLPQWWNRLVAKVQHCLVHNPHREILLHIRGIEVGGNQGQELRGKCTEVFLHTFLRTL